jgi:hypothetical protein
MLYEPGSHHGLACRSREKSSDAVGPVRLQGCSAGEWEERKTRAECKWLLPLPLPGEPFSQEEMEEMLSAAIDPESNAMNYRDYITMMVIDEN